MTETPLPPNVPAVPRAVPHRPSRWVSLVWLVPLVASVLGGWFAVKSLRERGSQITVSFTDAEGIEAGKTKVRYRSVDVGSVKSVTLGSDLRTVQVTIEMAKSVEPLLNAGTRFWVVRPRLGTNGVSGLGTLFSGVYIGMDATGAGKDATLAFAGLDTAPVVVGRTSGVEYILDSQDLGSLSVGAPAYFHHIQVGEISSLHLDSDGHGVTLTLFVEAPYSRFVTQNTRSGMQVVSIWRSIRAGYTCKLNLLLRSSPVESRSKPRTMRRPPHPHRRTATSAWPTLGRPR